MRSQEWFDSAEKNRQDAKSMIASGHRDWGLFVWHLALEKLIKALFVQKEQEVPLIHSLGKLVEKLNIDVTDLQFEYLDEITTFNLEARYDSEKFAFYKKATPNYTEKWNKICEELYLWLLHYKN